MPFVTGDGILETTTTTGTSTITLAGAVSGYRAMSAVATALNDTFYYSLRGGTEWEVGLGTRVSATTFNRTTVLASSNAGALVNFSAGTKEFWMDIPARVVLNIQTLTNELTGLKLSNNVSDTVNDIDIAAGAAADSTNRDMIRHEPTGTFTKRLDGGIWSVGTGAPGSDTATALADGTWYVYLIKRIVPGGPDVVDALFSSNATTPTLPTNYTLYRRIGAVIRSGGTILQFTQDGDFFWLTTVFENYDATLSSSVRTLITMTCPPNKIVLFRVFGFDAGLWAAIIQRVAETDSAPSETGPPGESLLGDTSSDVGEFMVLTNASSQIAARSTSTGASVDAFRVWTKGWIDRRGKENEG